MGGQFSESRTVRNTVLLAYPDTTTATSKVYRTRRQKCKNLPQAHDRSCVVWSFNSRKKQKRTKKGKPHCLSHPCLPFRLLSFFAARFSFVLSAGTLTASGPFARARTIPGCGGNSHVAPTLAHPRGQWCVIRTLRAGGFNAITSRRGGKRVGRAYILQRNLRAWARRAPPGPVR